jgi:hypothetical protein
MEQQSDHGHIIFVTLFSSPAGAYALFTSLSKLSKDVAEKPFS